MCLLRERTTKRLRRRSNFPKQTPNASDVAQTLPNKLPTPPTSLALCDKQLQAPPTSLKLCQTNFQRFRRRSHFVTNKLPAPLTPLKASKQPWTSSEASKLSWKNFSHFKRHSKSTGQCRKKIIVTIIIASYDVGFQEEEKPKSTTWLPREETWEPLC